MALIRLKNLNDARLRVFSSMTDAELRDPKQLVGLRRACDEGIDDAGLFIAESRNVIWRAMDAGYVPFAFLTDERWAAQGEELLERTGADRATEAEGPNPAGADIPLFVGTRDQIQELTGFERTRGPLAAFHRKPNPALADVLQGARRIAILENITNFTNVGAIFRSAAALGIDAVLVTPGCHDPLYRRAARVSMGAVFQVPWARVGSSEQTWTEETLPQLQQAGFTVAALALKEDSLALQDARIAQAEKLVLVLGTEGDGLAQSTIQACDHTVMIPMAHGTDSLNVAACAAVAFWETTARNA